MTVWLNAHKYLEAKWHKTYDIRQKKKHESVGLGVFLFMH